MYAVRQRITGLYTMYMYAPAYTVDMEEEIRHSNEREDDSALKTTNRSRAINHRWRGMDHDTTGKMWNIPQKVFSILPIVDFPHSAFYPFPTRRPC